MNLALHALSALLVAIAPPAEAAAQSSAAQQQASPFREQLLELGFDAASAIPAKPHERDRSLVQQEVGSTAVELGLVARAMACAKSMEGWRRGVVYGDLAIDAAKAGRTDPARTFAQYAIDSTGSAKDWQRDTVRVKVAQAMVWLGDDAAAGNLEKGVGEPEQGKVRAARVARGNGADFDDQMAEAERLVATGNFDLVRNALATCVELAQRAKGDEARWSRIVALTEGSVGKTARDIQLRAFLRLAEVRMQQGAPERAKELAARAVAIRDGSRWTTDFALPIAADIARTLSRIGDSVGARAEIDRALALFESDKARVADIFRAGALRPVAEALVVLGDSARARTVFETAIEEGALNPNARPRAMDLAQTCASLARAGIEPDAAMWERLRALRAGLVDPW